MGGNGFTEERSDESDDDSDFDEELKSLTRFKKEPAAPEVVVDVELACRKAVGEQEVMIPCKSNNTFKEVKTMLANRLNIPDLLSKIWLVHKSDAGVYVSFKDSDRCCEGGSLLGARHF